MFVCNIEEKERGSCKGRMSCKKGENLIELLKAPGYIADKKLSRFVLQKQRKPL